MIELMTDLPANMIGLNDKQGCVSVIRITL